MAGRKAGREREREREKERKIYNIVYKLRNIKKMNLQVGTGVSMKEN